jgi:hypothetical protein
MVKALFYGQGDSGEPLGMAVQQQQQQQQQH